MNITLANHMLELFSKILSVIAIIFLRSEWEELKILLSQKSLSLSLNVREYPPVIIRKILISGEDHRNGKHYGFDIYAICRVIWNRIIYKKREGASTVEQQLVRVMTGRYEYTLRRKFREILLATLVAKSFDKSTIVCIYLEVAYFGWRMNGYIEACHRLGFSPNSLTLDESIKLVARLKYPEPRTASSKRLYQIYIRKIHLKRLFIKHRKEGVYDHLGESHDNKTIQGKPIISKAFQLEF